MAKRVKEEEERCGEQREKSKKRGNEGIKE